MRDVCEEGLLGEGTLTTKNQGDVTSISNTSVRLLWTVNYQHRPCQRTTIHFMILMGLLVRVVFVLEDNPKTPRHLGTWAPASTHDCTLRPSNVFPLDRMDGDDNSASH
jgi:hypothetical protein